MFCRIFIWIGFYGRRRFDTPPPATLFKWDGYIFDVADVADAISESTELFEYCQNQMLIYSRSIFNAIDSIRSKSPASQCHFGDIFPSFSVIFQLKQCHFSDIFPLFRVIFSRTVEISHF